MQDLNSHDRKNNRTSWVAVKVWRGIPAKVKGFHSKKAAEAQERVWRKDINPDYDETAVLEMKTE